MNEVLLILAIVLLLLQMVSGYFLLKRGGKGGQDFEKLEMEVGRLSKSFQDEFSRLRQETDNRYHNQSESLARRFEDAGNRQNEMYKVFSQNLGEKLESFSASIKSFSEVNEKKLEKLGENFVSSTDKLRESVEKQLKEMQGGNEKKLDEMRKVVDEKLNESLQKRLGEAFDRVSKQLAEVHKGLGEMQSLSNGVGELRKVLSNVKTRGTLGEIQLGNLLEQILTPEQYRTQAQIRPGGREQVDFAVCLPGKDEQDKEVLLPIDSKFPQENYERLLIAQESGERAAIDLAAKALLNDVKTSAKSINEKYIHPPNTTDFALLFLPTEGLYAEVLRQPGFFEMIQRDYHIILTGPTTLAAILNSLQLGFKTLAIQKRSSEVWQILGAVKTEFGNFGGLLEKTRKQVETVFNSINRAASKSRTIERKLKGVESLPEQEAPALLGEASFHADAAFDTEEEEEN